jgi:hypothetical protein
MSPAAGPDPRRDQRPTDARSLRLQTERARRRIIRRRRLSALASVSFIVAAFAAAIVWVSGGFSSTRHVKVVHVVVASDRPTYQASPSVAHTQTPTQTPTQTQTHTTATSRAQPATHQKYTTTMPAASAGTNGSFTPPNRRHRHRTAAAPTVILPGAAASFASFARTQPGRVQVAVGPVNGTTIHTFGGNTPAPAWSTSKVPVLAALIKARGTAGLTAQEQSLANTAITESDNDSILALFGDLETLKGGLDGASLYVQDLFRESGDPSTVVTTAPPPPGGVTTFGQTAWSPADSVLFFRAFAKGCLIGGPATDGVLTLMEHIISSESWGFGSADFGTTVAFKGGWGPEGSAYLVRQDAIINPGRSSALAISVVAYPPAGSASFEVGTQMLTATAQWAAHETRPIPKTQTACG